jgi:hypothetical protein
MCYYRTASDSRDATMQPFPSRISPILHPLPPQSVRPHATAERTRRHNTRVPNTVPYLSRASSRTPTTKLRIPDQLRYEIEQGRSAAVKLAPYAFTSASI